MVKDGSYISEHRLMYKVVESLRGTPETHVTLCINYTSRKKEKKETSILVLSKYTNLFNSYLYSLALFLAYSPVLHTMLKIVLGFLWIP